MEKHMAISKTAFEGLLFLEVHLRNFKPSSRNTDELDNARWHLRRVEDLCPDNPQIKGTCHEIGGYIEEMFHPNPDPDKPLVYDESFEDKVTKAREAALIAYQRLADFISQAKC
jgi:hypothetical protein